MVMGLLLQQGTFVQKKIYLGCQVATTYNVRKQCSRKVKAPSMVLVTLIVGWYIQIWFLAYAQVTLGEKKSLL